VTDFIDFTEGQNYLLTHGNGLPATCYFLLSTNAVASFTAGSTLAGGVAEITGTSYARQSQAAPTPSAGAAAFTLMSWATGVHTDWPAGVKSVVLCTTVDNSGKAICAWNLIAGGASRDLSQANTTEQVTPTLSLT
jgi:hypothetical protein